jgi:hypothetical protein
MAQCNHCGAGLGPADTSCRYCGHTTDYGVQQQHAQQHWQQHRDYAQDQWDRHQQQADRAQAEQSLKRSASHALWWSLGSVVLCCFPASIVGFVLAIRSRRLARRTGLVIPSSATMAIVISSFGLLLGAVTVVYVAVTEMQLSDRRQELRKRVDKYAGDEKLKRKTACAMAELELLESGHGDVLPGNIDGFKCSGKMKRDGDLASVDPVRFRGTSEKFELRACFERGAEWYFKDFRPRDSSCEGDPPAAASASAGASASSSAANNAASAATSAPSSASAAASASASAAASARP